MPIQMKCTCGKSLRAGDHLAGKKVRCPGCQSVVAVPVPVLSPDPLPLPAPPPVVRPVDDELPMVVPAPRKKDADGHVMADEPAPRRRRDPIEEDDLRRRIASRPRFRETERPRHRDSSWFGTINAGMGGGIAMMVVAVIWFVVGLAAGWIFFYPPILFVLGLVAFIKGAAGSR
jgi:hypothetical protein